MEILDKVKFNEQGLVVAIAQDLETNEILMQAYMSREALKKTLETGKAHYFSRSRKSLWLKGETSSNYQYVKQILVDCDMDSIILKIQQEGVACHTGEKSCFYREVDDRGGIKKIEVGYKKNPSKVDVLEYIYHLVCDRRENPKEGSYTNYLLDKGLDKILKKVGEESAEVIIAAKGNDRGETIYEISDLFYHVTVLLASENISLDEVYKELKKRQ